MAPYLKLQTELDESPDSNNIESQSFLLPDDYFDFANIRVVAKKGNCSDVIESHEEKAENLHILLNDINRKPSFFYRETFYLLNSDGITIYTGNDFNITSAQLDYYKKNQFFF